MDEYEVVGVLDADVAAAMESHDGTVAVENDDPSQRLIVQPKDGDDS